MSIVYNTLEKLKTHLDSNINQEAIIHSDQAHYTHPEFHQRVNKMGILQSMSRRGNCLDNAPMESFFGHFKDEVNYKEAESLAELHTSVMECIDYYNNRRKQWTLKKMTPATYRGHLNVALPQLHRFLLNCLQNRLQFKSVVSS